MQLSNKISFENYFSCLHYTVNGIQFLKIKHQEIKNILFFLKLHTTLLFVQLVDLSFIDYFERKFRFELFFNLLSIQYNSRLIVNSTLEEEISVTSTTTIYPNANWYEREA